MLLLLVVVVLVVVVAAAAAAVVVMVRGGKLVYGETFSWEGGEFNVPPSSRTGRSTCTHPGVDEEGPRDGDALLLPLRSDERPARKPALRTHRGRPRYT